MAASNVACCPRHGPPPYPSSSESDNTANTTASTHTPTATSVNVQGPTAILTAVSAIPAVAAGGCQGHVLPTGSFGLASGPATPATAERWYAVISGRAVGVFEGWYVTFPSSLRAELTLRRHNVSPLVTGVSFAVFQRYTSRAAALAAFSAALAAGTVTVLP
ncbi:hypothetical protein A0H81_03917 [Grifola frondosa]|uniref:Uncharacterized protein n=1 Tax=Grifola frondosa TaxID=5627 RepID=A0A1C7MP30_GRIFR|nr:hypothetical protein A0H81_03917 [Grifola frondosa]